MLKKFLWKSEPRWVCMLEQRSRLSSNMRHDMVGDVSYKETFYVWAWTTLPIWAVWCWALYVTFREHRNCRVIRFLDDYIIHIDREDSSKVTIHNEHGDLIKQLEQSVGTVLLETLVSRYQVSPDAVRLNFSRTSDLMMIRLSTDLLLESEDVI